MFDHQRACIYAEYRVYIFFISNVTRDMMQIIQEQDDH
jgi:hypothetical protein